MATITTTQIPFSSPDLIRPGAGAEQWHNGSARIPYPTTGDTTENSADVYYRFAWNQVETATQGVYNWTYLDNLIKGAINKGQKLSFGIMEHRGETDGDGAVSYGGAISYYPLYLHNLMQSEVSTSRDWANNGIWIPNFNSPNYLARLRALNQAIRDHLLNTRYTPTSGPNVGKNVLFADAIYCIDIRGFGTWGEWHTSNGMSEWSQFPSGRQPSISALKAIIDAHTQVLDKWPLVIMIAAYDGGSSQFGVFHPYPEVAWYAITARSGWGKVGFRKDQWGARDAYLARLAESNFVTYGTSGPFKDTILNIWKEAPVTGEPMPGTWADMGDLERQVRLYHATSVGNGNYGGNPGTAVQDQIRASFKAAGYRLTVEGGSYTNTNNSVSVSLNWRNTGIAPTYENWNVVFYLKNSNGTVADSSISTFKPKLFNPSTSATIVTDNFTFNVPAGTYTLAVKVTDPAGYRNYMPLFIQGIQSDGSYNLGSVVVGTVPITTTTTTSTTTKIPITTTTTTTGIPITTTTTKIPIKTIKRVTMNILYTDGSTSSQIIQ